MGKIKEGGKASQFSERTFSIQRSLALISFMTNFCRDNLPRYLTTTGGTAVNIWDCISLATPN